MRIRYDPEVDALYIHLMEEPEPVTTRRLTDDVAVDYGADGTVVGIEVLAASENAFCSGDARRVRLENLMAVSQ